MMNVSNSAVGKWFGFEFPIWNIIE